MSDREPKDPRYTTLSWYLPALGTFVSAFSIIEHILNEVLWVYTGVSPEMGRAIFSSSRVDFCCQALIRIIDAQKLTGERIDELRIIIEQIGVIARTRNDILHFGISKIEEDKVIISNHIFAHVENRVRALHLERETFEDLKVDMDIILERLVSAYECAFSPRAPIRRARLMAI
jgi:hypothetical protein